jgi:hypothetical protein
MEVQSYIIDVSNPKCWNELTTSYKPKILEILDDMRPLFNGYVSYASAGLTLYRMTGGVIMYEKEIQEIAQILEISFIECLLFQLVYEFCSACTSAILKADGKYVHVRTLDWELDKLKDITVQIKIVNKDKHLFDAITWAGFVGIFTGIKPDNYTIALNYRRSENPNIMTNIISLFKGYYPNAFFIRDLLTRNDTDEAYDRLKKVLLIAPAYYTFMSETVKCVIIRDRQTFKIRQSPCVQTNSDDSNGDNIMLSHERSAYMNEVIFSNPTLNALIEYIERYPVNNEHTVYTVIMNPQGFLYFKK